MKKALSISTLILVAVVTFSFTKIAIDKWTVKQGSTLVYSVVSGSENYDLTATVSSINAEGLKLNLAFANQAQTNSNVMMSQASLENSHNQVTRFKNGDQTLDKGLAIWISKGMFNELTYGKSYTYLDGNTAPTPLVSAGTETMNILVNGVNKSVSVIHAKQPSYNGETKLAEYWILNDVENPIILKMITDITCQIKSVTL